MGMTIATHFKSVMSFAVKLATPPLTKSSESISVSSNACLTLIEIFACYLLTSNLLATCEPVVLIDNIAANNFILKVKFYFTYWNHEIKLTKEVKE